MNEIEESSYERWARFRLSVVGGLLASPPPRGELCHELEKLAAKVWVHPIKGTPKTCGESERCTLPLCPCCLAMTPQTAGSIPVRVCELS